MKNLIDALHEWVQHHRDEIEAASDLSAAAVALYQLVPGEPLWRMVVDFAVKQAGAGRTLEQVLSELSAGALMTDESAASDTTLRANWETIIRMAKSRRDANERAALLELSSTGFVQELERSVSAAVAGWKKVAAVLPSEVGSIVLPHAEERALPPADAEVLLRGVSGLEGKAPSLFVPADRYVHKLTLTSSTTWLRWVVYAPLLRDTRFVDADFAYATEQLSLADAARITIALCDARSRRGGWLGEPFFWVSLADQVSTGRYRGRNPVDDVLQAHALVEQLVGSGLIKDPAPLVERLVDVQLGRQLQGLVFDLRRAARTATLSEVLPGLTGEPSRQPKGDRGKPTAPTRRTAKAKSRPLSDEDVSALKTVLLASEGDDDNPGAIKLLVARPESVGIHVYNEKGGKHHRPHVHVLRRGEDVAVVFIDDPVEVDPGTCTLTGRAKQGLFDWVVTHQRQLRAAWDVACTGGTPVRIDR